MAKKRKIPKDEYIRLRNQGLLDKQIAYELGVSVPSLNRAKKRWDLKGKVLTTKKAMALVQRSSKNPETINKLEDLADKLAELYTQMEVRDLQMKDLIYNYVAEQLKEVKKNGGSSEAGIAMLLKSIR